MSATALQNRPHALLIQSICETFSHICGTDSVFDRCYPRAETLAHFAGVSGFIGLAGATCGSITLHVPAQTACLLISRMSGLTLSTVDNDVADGVGELTNIIAGRAKFLMRSCGFFFDISLPKVAYGQDYDLTQNFKIPSIVFEFSSAAGPFLVDVTLVSNVEKTGDSLIDLA